jgi:predicted ATPase
MLTRFRVNNFKNLINVEFRPAGLNLLIGQNNAGKTNLCQALHFFALASRMPLKDAAQFVIGEVWKLTNAYQENRLIEFQANVCLDADDGAEDFAYALALEVERHPVTSIQTLRVSTESLRLSQGGVERLLISNQSGQAEVLDETRPNQAAALKVRIPEGHTALSKLFDEQAHPHCLSFRKYLSHWAYFNLNPLVLRSARVAGPFPLITPQGENLGQFLATLQNQMPRVARSVLAALRRIEPKAEFFAFSYPDPEHVVWFLEDKQGHRFGVQHLSEGTLRYLALCCIIVGLEESPEFYRPPPLVMVEEPENGLHVNELKPLLARINPSGNAGQFIFTSHSPYFIDLFDKHLDGIHLLKATQSSAGIVRPDPAKIQPLLEDMPLGELHFHELLA